MLQGLSRRWEQTARALRQMGVIPTCGKVAKSVVRVKVVSVAYLSVNKAFGTVSHGCLISKLRKCSLAKVTSK